ncbi:hypothetical protein EGW08_002180, partial [Elysia chlorotica]
MNTAATILLVSCAMTCLVQTTLGCYCPSCHQADGAERCMCCVYRQLGKRSGNQASALPMGPPPKQTEHRSQHAAAAFRETPMSVFGARDFPLPSILRDYPTPASTSDSLMLGGESYIRAFLGPRSFLQAQG